MAYQDDQYDNIYRKREDNKIRSTIPDEWLKTIKDELIAAGNKFKEEVLPKKDDNLLENIIMFSEIYKFCKKVLNFDHKRALFEANDKVLERKGVNLLLEFGEVDSV